MQQNNEVVSVFVVADFFFFLQWHSEFRTPERINVIVVFTLSLEFIFKNYFHGRYLMNFFMLLLLCFNLE